jgi:hypothetical protein
MTDVTIQSAGPRDRAMHEGQYERFVALLREDGYDVELDSREFRFVLPVSPDIVIHIAEGIEAAKTVADIVKAARQALRRMRRPPSGERRRVVIYGPDGEELSTVELEDDDA